MFAWRARATIPLDGRKRAAVATLSRRSIATRQRAEVITSVFNRGAGHGTQGTTRCTILLMRKTPLLLLVVLFACGKDSIGFDDFPGGLEGAQCGFQVDCDLQPDNATCQASIDIDDGEVGSLDAAIADGTVIYDAEAAQACVDAIRGQGCSFPGFQDRPDPCDDVFTGTVATGGACIIDVECANGGSCAPTDVNCDPDVSCCAGTCQGMDTPLVAIGGVCEGGDCVANAFCKFPAGANSGTCTAAITTAGTACDELDACANPMVCDLDFATGMGGTCVTPAGSNQACDPGGLIACGDLRDYCDPASMKCTRRVDVGGACPTGVRCVGFATCVNAVCLADPKLGEACVVDGAQDCLGSLSCINGTCQLPPASMVCQ